jgi:hypothetical protein
MPPSVAPSRRRSLKSQSIANRVSSSSSRESAQTEHNASSLDDFRKERGALHVALERAAVENLCQLIEPFKFKAKRLFADFKASEVVAHLSIALFTRAAETQTPNCLAMAPFNARLNNPRVHVVICIVAHRAPRRAVYDDRLCGFRPSAEGQCLRSNTTLLSWIR